MNDAIIDPESDNGTSLVEGLEETGQATTDGRRGNLGDVDWRNSSNSTNSHAGEKTSSIDESDLVFGDRTQDGSDDEDSIS